MSVEAAQQSSIMAVPDPATIPNAAFALTRPIKSADLKQLNEASNPSGSILENDSSSSMRTRSLPGASVLEANLSLRGEAARNLLDLSATAPGSRSVSSSISGDLATLSEEEQGTRNAGLNSETVSAIGLGFRRGDDIEPVPQPFSFASPWSDSSSDLSSHRQAPSAFAESAGGSDSGRTNVLLEQILDELRKLQQPSYIASGRSVYPER